MRNVNRSSHRKFNYDKLQAVLCMAASACVSIALLIWGVRSLL